MTLPENPPNSDRPVFEPTPDCIGSMKLILEYSPNISILLDRDTNILHHSRDFFRLLGIAETDCHIGRPLCSVYWKFQDAGFVGRSLQRLGRIMTGGDDLAEVDTIEWPTVGKRSYRVSYSRVNDAHGDLYALAITLTDVTDLWELENERRIQDTLNSTQSPCMVWDEHGKVIGCNKELLRIFDIPPDQPLDELLTLIEPKYQPDGTPTEDVRREFVQDVLNNGFGRCNAQLQRHDGTPIYMGVPGFRMTGGNGDRIVIYLHDLTETRTKESEEHIRLMLDSTPLMCILRDEFNYVIDCNREALKAFGLSKKTELFGDLRRFFPEYQPDGSRSLDKRKELWNSLSEEKPNIDLEWTFRTTTGELLPVETKLVRIPWKDTYRVLSYSRDLRETKKILAESNEANDRVRLMLDSNPMICILRDENDKVIDCNQVALNEFGVSDKSELARRFADFYPEFQPDGSRSVDKAKKIRDRLFQKGTLTNIEWTFLTSTGEPLPVELTLVRIPWKDTHRVLSYSRDLRETKRILAETEMANERIRLLLDSNPLMCFLHDDQGKVIDCNGEALKIFGIASKNDLVTDIQHLCPEFQSDGGKTADILAQAIESAATMGTYSYFDWTFRLPTGELLPVETKLVRIPWQDTFRIVSFSRDLREVKAAEQKVLESNERNINLERQKEAIHAASEAKSQFLASMSHEIRTPMNIIIGLLDLMRTDNLDTEQIKSIGDVKRTSELLLLIINDILDFHKIESGKLEILPVHFDLGVFCNDLVSRHQFLAENKGLQFKSGLAPNLPQVVFGDELRMNQIITNLLSNAIKYTQSGHVSFSVDSATKGGQKLIAFTVEDTGVGIKEENLPFLFKEFEQFDQLRHRGITGTGLGLSIAKRLTEMMGGTIRVKSDYEKGSQFTVLLPLVKGDLDKIKSIETIERVRAMPGTRVLVVDDNAGNITVAMGLLARHNIFPDAVRNGHEAIEMVRTQQYDLVFMDHMMPEMDGVEATAIIRSLEGEYYRKLPIVALSANAVVNAQEQFLQCGMNDFVSKPIISSDLNRALLRWLPPRKIAPKETEPKVMGTPLDEPILNKRLQSLAQIEELCIATGLSRLDGDKKLYIDILRQFCNSVKEDIDSLKQWVKGAEWKAYAIRVHAIKSGLAMIGNQSLSDWARTLEQAATQGHANKCKKENGNFCTVLSKFQSKLLRAGLMTDGITDARKTPITSKALKKELEILLRACNDFQADTAEPKARELLAVTLNAPMDASLTRIHDLIYAFDYDKAAELITESMAAL